MSRSYRPSIKKLITYWLLALFSLFLLWPTGSAILGDIGSFRSCNVNSSDLSVTTCGKDSVNPGDGLLIVLFICSALLAVAFFTHAYRLSRRLST